VSEAVQRRIRRAARIVLLDPDDRVLLFRYVTVGFDPFWILPGGECDPGEDYAQAARRELREETGIDARPEPLGVEKRADYVYMGEPVAAVEQFFRHRTPVAAIDTAGHTALEREVMQEHRWFTRVEIEDWPETIYPLDIVALIDRAIDEEDRRHGRFGSLSL
jgi:8-oxo-dGTP pyrophosphatase MutT (NUDIX family)